MNRNMCSRQKSPLLMRTSVDRVFNKVGGNAAIIQQGIALCRCAIPDDPLSPLLCVYQKLNQFLFDLHGTSFKCPISIEAREAGIFLPCTEILHAIRDRMTSAPAVLR